MGAETVLVGTDLVSVDRLAALLAAQPGLETGVFTARELRYAGRRRRRHEHLAARLAAKEAVFKALGARGMSWLDVEVVNAASGRPRLRLAGAAQAHAQRAGVRSMEISLSHTAGLAVAFTAMVCEAP